MSLNKNIFDRLSLKKKITLNRQNKISEQLSSESEKNASLIEQIKDLQNQRKADNSALRSGYFLKSQNWYSQKLIEELSQTETKQKFIKKELAELQKKIAFEHQNMKRAKTKADEKRKKEASLLEAKKELMTPKINKL
jgi:hypothetical protein|tara:strand:+ start:513 stop:926 length:414 start_codon:yes stop_codon:yes gene_type:complete